MKRIAQLNHFLHNHLLGLLLFMYGFAAVFPFFGIAIKKAELGQIHWDSSSKITISLPLIMLAFLLFNAGFSIKLIDLKKALAAPSALLVGLLTNLTIPLIFTVVFSVFGKLLWHNPDEIQNILVGLAIIASMPIAGSSTAWVQNAAGNSALILGLVVCSTILSPLVSPAVFHLVEQVTTGDYSEDLHEIALQGTSLFLIVSVVVPSLFGIALRSVINHELYQILSPVLKALNLVVLLLLNYSNAAVSLPLAIANCDLDFLAIIAFTTSILCILSFTAGWLIPKLLIIPTPERVSLTFGLGMNNNGTGLVLASSTMADHPLVMLPIIFYNLGQQVVAGIFTAKLRQRQTQSLHS